MRPKSRVRGIVMKKFWGRDIEKFEKHCSNTNYDYFARLFFIEIIVTSIPKIL